MWKLDLVKKKKKDMCHLTEKNTLDVSWNVPRLSKNCLAGMKYPASKTRGGRRYNINT